MRQGDTISLNRNARSEARRSDSFVPRANFIPEQNESANEIIAARGRIGGSIITSRQLLNTAIEIHNLKAGEDIAIREALSFTPNIIDEDKMATTLGDKSVGNAAASAERADNFVTSYAASIVQVTLRIKKVGSPTDGRINIYSNVAGSPGAVLGFVAVTPASISTSYQDLTFTITGLSLSALTNYWAGLGNITLDASNYYVLAYKSAGSHKVFDNSGGGTWSFDNDGELVYRIRSIGGTGVANTVFQATALLQDSADKFIGFADAPSAGSSVRVRTGGKMAKFSLTATSLYYLSDTHGAIATSAGTVSKKVGRAITATELQIEYTL